MAELEAARKTGDRDAVSRLSLSAAELEEEIAGRYLEIDRWEDAAVNLISRASCLADCHHLEDAEYAYRRAYELTKVPEALAWIRRQLEQLSAPQAIVPENAASRWRWRAQAFIRAVRIGARTYADKENLDVAQTKEYRTPRKFWKVPELKLDPELPPGHVEDICRCCHHPLDEAQQRTLLLRGGECPHCGDRV